MNTLPATVKSRISFQDEFASATQKHRTLQPKANTNWTECLDKITDLPYYWNTETKEVTWDKPKEYVDYLNYVKATNTVQPEEKWRVGYNDDGKTPYYLNETTRSVSWEKPAKLKRLEIKAPRKKRVKRTHPTYLKSNCDYDEEIRLLSEDQESLDLSSDTDKRVSKNNPVMKAKPRQAVNTKDSKTQCRVIGFKKNKSGAIVETILMEPTGKKQTTINSPATQLSMAAFKNIEKSKLNGFQKSNTEPIEDDHTYVQKTLSQFKSQESNSKLKNEIACLCDLISDKIKFLSTDKTDISTVQVMSIQFETLQTAFCASCLDSNYFLNWLKKTSNDLLDLEQSPMSEYLESDSDKDYSQYRKEILTPNDSPSISDKDEDVIREKDEDIIREKDEDIIREKDEDITRENDEDMIMETDEDMLRETLESVIFFEDNESETSAKSTVSSVPKIIVNPVKDVQNLSNGKADKRTRNNASERRRRNAIQDNLIFLRKLVPSSEDNKAESLASVLEKAVKCISSMKRKENVLQKILAALKKKQYALNSKLKHFEKAKSSSQSEFTI